MPLSTLSKRLASFLSLAALSLLLAIPRPAQAYPVLLWTGLSTSPGTGIVFPFLFVSGNGKTISPSVYGAFGLSERFDVIAGTSGIFGLDPFSATFGQVDVSPRFLVTPELALSPRLIYTSGQSFVISPEVHATKSIGDLMLTLNAGVRPSLGLNGEGLTSTTAFAYFSSSYFLTKQFWFVLEADPSLTFTRGTETADASTQSSLFVSPGVGFATDENQTHIFELAALFSVPTTSSASFEYASSVTYVFWYATSFDLWGK
jgi:hypothetical protein